MITMINRNPVRSTLASDGVHFNKKDLYAAFNLPSLISADDTLTAEEMLDLFFETFDENHPDIEAIDVWLRDAIDAHDARALYPPESRVGDIINYWERVALVLTGKTPRQLLEAVKGYGLDVQSWQDALRHLDYLLAIAVSVHVHLMGYGLSFDEASRFVWVAVSRARNDPKYQFPVVERV
jgi:hypothetical protein